MRYNSKYRNKQMLAYFYHPADTVGKDLANNFNDQNNHRQIRK
jgi:hypothetical protein